MNVRVVGGAQTRAPEPAAGRAGGGSADFPSMMDAVLGDAPAERPAARPSDRPSERDAERGAARDGRGVRSGEARSDRRDAARASSGEEPREPGPEDDRPVEGPGGNAPQSASAPRRATSRRAEDEVAREESDAVAAAPDAAVVDPSTVAIPELIALVRGDVADAAEASSDSPAEALGEGEAFARGPGVPGIGTGGAGAMGGAPSDPAGAADAADEASVASPEVTPVLVEAEASERGPRAVAIAAGAPEQRAGDPGQLDVIASPPTDEVAGRASDAQQADGAASAAATRSVPLETAEAKTASRGDAAMPTATSPRPADAPPEATAPDGSARLAADDDRMAAAASSERAASEPSAPRGQDAPTPARADALGFAPMLRAPDAPAPAGESGRPLPAAAPDAIAIQTDWLATRGGGTARLVLHPPELGEIAIRVTVRHQAVDVVMVAHTALAQQAAEDQSERLSQAFASRDLRLEQFEVRRGDPSDASSAGQFGSSDAGTRERERAEEGAFSRGDGVGRRGARRGGAAGENVAAPPPRIVSTGRASGIDLRI